jgi:hypothetical protein
MDEREIYIKRNIETAREAMSEKIGLLGTRINKAVIMPKLAIDAAIVNMDRLKEITEEAKSSIDYGLDVIPQAVEETILKIKSTANSIAQAEQNPWMMLGSAILIGYAIGSLARGALVAKRYTATQVEESYR